MWKRIFGRKHNESVTLSTQTYFDDQEKIVDNEKLNVSYKTVKLDNISRNMKIIESLKGFKRKFTANQGSGSATIIVPELTESGNQTSLHDISEHGMQTEREPPSATMLIRCEVGNQTELTVGGRGEMLQVETVMSYETPIDAFRNQHPIVTPAELLQALQELAMQQDASGDF